MTILCQTSPMPQKISWIVACLLIFVTSTTSAETMTGMVVGVADGDTVTVLVNGHDQIHVRIMGIDAPEKKQAMSDCAFGKQTQVEWSKKDRYGRTVGITDGDTVTVLVERREINVRIGGIDAPEKNQAFGQR